MVTRLDLSTVRMHVESLDQSVWHYVEYKGERFILVATNLTFADIERMMETDPVSALMFALGSYPMVDTAVFRGDEEWNIVGECSDECEEGVCSRRIATTEEIGDIEQAYVMLVDYLNA